MFSMDDLYAIMREVFGLRTFRFTPDMTSKDVPGWNSLNHTVLLMEIESETSVDLTAEETLALPTIGSLYERIVSKPHENKGR